jgi:tRNA uridine 5-carboxymethylaminomethyl modification enzyme
MDNALVRLGRRAAEIGLLSKDDEAAMNAMLLARHSALDALKTLRRDGMSLFDRMKRTGEDDEAVWNWIQSTVGESEAALSPSVLNDALREHLLIEARYDGYIRRQSAERARVARMEAVPLPADVDYARVPSLKTEARATLARFKPATLGQAARLSGVTPADVSALAVYLKNAGG